LTASISIIIPTLNESSIIVDTLRSLQPMRARGHEIILVDGGSGDDTIKLAQPYVDKTISTSPGRARQMNKGALNATKKFLWFLHADTCVPEDVDQLIVHALNDDKAPWGYFDVRLSGKHLLLRVVEKSMNLRTRLTGIATGDQGIFITKENFFNANGFADIPLMEDIELSRRLKKYRKPVRLYPKIITSSRRWEKNGILKTIFLMWRLRLAYALGADPQKLAILYR